MTYAFFTTTALVSALATSALAVEKTDVLNTYADIAAAGYGDSLSTAQTLQTAVNALITNPSAQALQEAKTAWLAARVPYQQTEVFALATQSSMIGKAK